MKKAILRASLFIFTVLGTMSVLDQSSATTPEAKQAFEKWQAAWNALKADPRYPEEYGEELEGLFSSGAFDEYKNQIFSISVEAIAPGQNGLLRELASGYLFKIGTDSALDILREYVNDPELSAGLSYMLGESKRPTDVEAVLPILREHRSYYILSSVYDSLVYTWLLEDVNNPDPAVRFGAAMILKRRFGDSTFFLPCAREFVRAYEIDVALKETAIDALVGQNPVPTEDVRILASAVSLDTSASLSWYALAAVVTIAKRGEEEALIALEAIRDTCHLMDYRERAGRIAKNIRHTQGK